MAGEPSVDLFVPGRLCILGEHSDWAGAFRSQNLRIPVGMTLSANLQQGILATASKNDTVTIGNGSTEINLSMNEHALGEIARGPGYWRLAAAAALVMFRSYGVGGVRIAITDRGLPVGRGLGSSAAICVVVVRAFAALYELDLTTFEEMGLSYDAEKLTGSLCGRMDQVCATGNGFRLMTHDGESSTGESIPSEYVFHFLVVDLGQQQSKQVILRGLQTAYPVPTSLRHRRLHRALGDQNHKLVKKACRAITDGSASDLGRVMSASQIELDRAARPICRNELDSSRLYSILTDPIIRRATYGGKGVGSHGGSAAQLLCKSIDLRSGMICYIRDTYGYHSFPLDVPDISS